MPVQLSNAIASQFINSVDPILQTLPDDAVAWMLRNNIYSFSGAKSFQELQELSALVMDGDTIRSRADFKKQALSVHSTYNLNYLATEQDLAIATAQNSARWWEFDEDSMLKYRTAGDSRVREEHRKLDGIRRRKNHPFWLTYYPPNGHKCRCEATEENETTEYGSVPTDLKIPGMFRTNFAISGVIFPDESAYYKGITDDALLMMRPAWTKVLAQLGSIRKRGLSTTDIVSVNVFSQMDSNMLSRVTKMGFSNKFVDSYKRAIENVLRKSPSYSGTAYTTSAIGSELKIGQTLSTDSYIVANPNSINTGTVYVIEVKSGFDISSVATTETNNTIVFKPGLKLFVSSIVTEGENTTFILKEL